MTAAYSLLLPDELEPRVEWTHLGDTEKTTVYPVLFNDAKTKELVCPCIVSHVGRVPVHVEFCPGWALTADLLGREPYSEETERWISRAAIRAFLRGGR